MRRPARIFALALALMITPLVSALAAAGPAAASSTAATAVPNTAHWVFVEDLPNEQWICYYVGNQLVSSGQYQNYACLVGPPGQLALWGLTYP